MSVVASVAINVDSRDAAAKLRQFQQQSTAAGRAAEQLQQGTTAAGQAAQSAGRQFQTAANGLKYYIDAAGRARKENGQFVTTAEAAAAGLKKQARAGDEAGRSMSKLEGIMKQLGLAVGAAGVGRFAAGLTRTAATFEGELRKAAAIEGGGNFNQLRQDVERVAAAAAGTPTQVAALATSLSRAGFTAAETGQSLQGIVRGAEATGLSFEQMGSIVSDSMRSFGIETAKTESVVDILVKTANSSNQTVQDLGESLKYAAPIARSLGVNITDLSATMAILANNGIRGSEAGTALRTGLAKLQLAASASNGELLDLLSGNKQLADSMKALGVSVTDASGKLKPLDDVLINLKRGLEGLGPGVQAEVLQALFGEEAGGKLRAALNSTEEEIRKMFGTIRAGAGAAAETQKEMQGFSYSMEVLGGNVEIVSNAIGDKFIAVLQPMIKGLNDAISASQQLPKPLRDVAAGAAAVGIAVGGVVLAMRTLIPLVKTLAALMGIGGLGGLIAAGPWIALAAGVAAAGVAIYQAANAQQEFNDVMAYAPIDEVKGKIADLQNQLAAAETKLLETQSAFGALSREAAFAQAKVDGLRGALELAQGDYKIRLLYEEVGVTPVSGYFGPGFKAPKQEKKKAAIPTIPTPTLPTKAKGGGGRSAADKAASEAKRLAEELARSKEQGEQLARTISRQMILLDEASETERKRLQIGFDYEDRQRQIAELKDKEQRINITQISQELRRVELRQLDLQITRDQLAAFEKIAGISFANTEGLGARAFSRAPADPTANFGMGSLLAQTPAEQQMAAYRAELDALTNPINMAVTGANAIGDAFGAAFQDIATGAKSTEQALADTFKAIGEAFISMAAQIIAKQLAMIAFQTILKALGGGGGGGGLFSGAGPVQMPSGGGFMEGFTGANFFADGGFVTGPTNAVIGEGGEPEYVIPQSKMASAMARYSRGARGAAVIPGNGESGGSGGGIAVAAPIDVRYTVERINSVDYVTADQFQRGMAQAANQGAKQGEQLAMRRLQQSASTRSRLGI